MHPPSDLLPPATSRRRFLKRLTTGGAVFGFFPTVLRATASRASPKLPIVKQYKRLGTTDLKLADISFGGSRLRHDVALVEHALDRGINYFDTAEDYTGGHSEETLGMALRGKRHKVHLGSKGGFGPEARRDEMMRTLEGSLRRLRTDYLDLYFIHAVNDIRRLHNPEFYEFTAQAKRQGKIRYVGLSGHGGRLIECLEYAIQSRRFDVMLVAYNFGQDPSFLQRFTRSFDFIAVNPELPRVLRQAKDAGMGVIAMKTLRGARLNSMEPYQKDGATFAQAAFRWVLSNRHVDALIVSMRSIDQVNEYLAASGGVRVSRQDRQLLEHYLALNDATYCRPLCDTCLSSCPAGVPINDVLRHRMYFEDYGERQMARERYARLETNASACLTCTHQACTSACPFGLQVPERTRQAHLMLSRS